ncbi:MAG TPA: lipoprotein [Steroidobacteraceae bacterium]|nr:lipoprotein [Steroidobacteraceae bacterium]
MTRAWLLAALSALALGGCGQKGPLYLPDKGGKVVTRAPAATEAQPPPPANEAPAAPATPKPIDKDKDQEQDSQPPK